MMTIPNIGQIWERSSKIFPTDFEPYLNKIIIKSIITGPDPKTDIKITFVGLNGVEYYMYSLSVFNMHYKMI